MLPVLPIAIHTGNSFLPVTASNLNAQIPTTIRYSVRRRALNANPTHDIQARPRTSSPIPNPSRATTPTSIPTPDSSSTPSLVTAPQVISGLSWAENEPKSSPLFSGQVDKILRLCMHLCRCLPDSGLYLKRTRLSLNLHQSHRRKQRNRLRQG